MPWTTPHHPTRVALDACVTCGLCLPVCPTFRITGDESASPRGRLAAMNVVDIAGAAVDERFTDIMSLCLQCRACETACPSLVPFGEAMEGARAEVQEQAPPPGSRLRRIGLTRVLRSRFLLLIATIGASLLQRLRLLGMIPVVGEQARGLRRLSLPVRSAAGGSWGYNAVDEQPVAMLLSGCVADVWFSDVHRATIEVLVAAGYRVEAPSGQTCCGALASHGGFADAATDMAVNNINMFKRADVVVADVAGCGAHLKSYGRYGHDGGVFAGKVNDINEVVAAAVADGRLPTLTGTGERVGVHDPCHLEHGQGSHTSVDAVLLAAGLDPIPIDRGGLCCGAAGTYQLEHPAMSAELGQRKAATMTAARLDTIATANAGCEMQLRRYLKSGITLRHPVEIYAERLRTGQST